MIEERQSKEYIKERIRYATRKRSKLQCKTSFRDKDDWETWCLATKRGYWTGYASAMIDLQDITQ